MTKEKYNSEMEDLRKFKAVALCKDIRDNLTLSGEDLGKTKDKIDELLKIQNKRIEAFNSLFKEVA